MYKDESLWASSAAALSLTPEVQPPSATSRVRARLAPLLREPLTHFLLFGILIFIVAHAIEARSKRYVIEVGAADITRIANSYTQQYGAPPEPAQVRTMVDNYIREEIYLREGLALGLDKNDEIVRRRVAQKFDFLQQDMAVPHEPGEAQLRDWYSDHAADFTVPARRSFDQVYFAIDRRGEAAAKALASDAAARLARGGPAPKADEFPGPAVIARLSQEDLSRLFGGDRFAAQVFAAKPGAWVGPFRSGFGWHVLRVTEAEPARPRSFEAARADIRIAWQQADRLARNGETYRQLQAHYRISRADGQ